MAIKKILGIKNVGRLVNCSHKGPEFKRCNLVFAENGRGKTTLCAVLRSLQTGEHEHITERKTIGPVTGDPSASLRIDAGTVTYGKSGWSATVPEVAIFDATFVARNVHAGEYVNRDHRSNLLQVIVGESGVALAEKVVQLDAAIREKNSDITKAKKALQAHLPAGANLEDFLVLAQDPEIDAKLVAKASERDAAKQAESIKSKQTLSALTVPMLPANMLPVLAKTLADVSVEAEKRLRQHIADHDMKRRGESWISEGLAYLKDEACPFCGQSTKAVALIETYKQYFSEAYAALIKEIAQLRQNVESAFGDAAVANLNRTVAVNDTGAQFWKPFVGAGTPWPAQDQDIGTAAAALRDAAVTLIAKKQSDPLSSVTPEAAFQTSATAYQTVAASLATYNTAVAAVNTAIAVQKEKATTANLAAREKELGSLALIKLRHEVKIAPLAADCIKLASDKDQLDKQKDAAKTALDTHAHAMIKKYEASINKLLKGFGAGFSITNSKKTYVGGTPTSAYQILINNQPVDLGDSATPVGTPCFRTTLSAGDKSTLALAFFLAQLEHDPKRAERIVVFDDPFNSQDRSRRERTAELLKKCGKECAQILVFSHDPQFLALVHEKLPKAERHALQLSRVPDNTTTIEEWDVEKETQDGYFKDHAALASYLQDGAKELIDIARKIRPVMEGYLRYRFPNQFPANEWLGDMIKRIRDSNGAHPLHSALDELGEINDFSKKYHHETNPGKADSEPVNDGELQSFVQRTLFVVGGY